MAGVAGLMPRTLLAAALSVITAAFPGGCGYTPARVVADRDLWGVYHALVDALGDANLSQADRYAAYRMLREGEKDVIPLLIEHLTDDRTFVPLAEAPSGTEGDAPVRKNVGNACSSLLQHIVSGGNWDRTRPIKDWARWWEANKHKSLPEIINEYRGER